MHRQGDLRQARQIAALAVVALGSLAATVIVDNTTDLQEALDTAAMVMALILISIVGMTLFALVVALERWLVPRDARVD